MLYHFTITISGEGETREEAWAEACTDFGLDRSEPPSAKKREQGPTEYYTIEEVE